MLTLVQTTHEIDHALGDITATRTGATTWDLSWDNCHLGQVIQDRDGFYCDHSSQPHTLPDIAHLMLIKYIDLIRLSNDYAYQQILQVA